MSEVLSLDILCPKYAEYLDVFDLCSLDATSQEVSTGLAHAWMDAASHLNLSIAGVDKGTIKAVVGAMQKQDVAYPTTISLRSAKRAQNFIRSAEQVACMRAKYFTDGGQHGKSFMTCIQFKEEDVAYVKDRNAPISSIPVPITVGKHTLWLTWTWKGETMWLNMHVPWV